MATLFKWLLRIAGSLVILSAIILGLVYFFASRSLPDYNKDLQTGYVSAPVEIVRNNANVPHIFGAQDSDVFFALGYAHAQDRLWQMMTMRRTAQGRLSEIFGSRTVRIDSLIRRLDIYPLAVKSVDSLSPRSKTLMTAYANGVNARINEVNRAALGRGAPEMFLFTAPIAPWQVADSVAIQKVMALQLTDHLQDEVLRARVSLVIPDEARLADVMPDAPGAGVATLPEYAAIMPPVPQFERTASLAPHPLSPFKRRGMAGASNAWAAAPGRSASSGTLLANDPHLELSAPSIWYLARLQLQSGGVIGGTIPGIPAVLSGRSDALGWGLTAAHVDDQDVLIEELNPNNPNQYKTPDGYKDFLTRKSIIQIKDEAPITLTLRWSDNGPVLPGDQFDLKTITPKGHVAAVSWTALSPQDTSMNAAIDLMYARTVREAIASAEAYLSPATNLTLVDRQAIALKTVGALPRRAAGHQSQGRMPSLGWRKENRWQGRLPYSSNPQFISPVGGILGNTNNKVIDRPYPLHLSFSWGDSQRVQRWQRLMQSREVHTRDSFIEAQLDTVSFTARSLLPLVGADLWFTGETAPEGTQERQRQRALTLLAEWNGEMNEHLPEPLIYSAWMRALQKRLIQDELGPLTAEFTHLEPLFIERVFRDVDGAAIWCDVVQSAPTETCSDMARLALDDALIWIDEKYGAALESLRWGDAHQAAHDHQVLGDVPLLKHFVNIRQSTSGGDNTLQRGKSIGTGPDPFRNVHAAGYRGVYDFADPDSSVFIISTGQSGHFLSRHYDDMAQLWRRGEYVPMSLDEELARAAAVGITRLLP
ncbi:penicillin acylase family protein [Cognatishimia sp. SS12]|uniref:penicillin acylase family protein n=1 Tax=Cognatishimia sp. SS12 TaxID=2979465 RepID=UPI00232E61F0|nr:penicillin acylase family protein [Cognatishimia sp. SS12]MDC0737125.1 penicillin acylase family protein [Cognatishimia sp. SS12]